MLLSNHSCIFIRSLSWIQIVREVVHETLLLLHSEKVGVCHLVLPTEALDDDVQSEERTVTVGRDRDLSLVERRTEGSSLYDARMAWSKD